MTAENRDTVLRLVAETVAAGASQEKTCETLGVTEKSVQRWRLLPILEDQRCGPKTQPANKLSPEERAKLVAVATNPEFRDLSPHQIVPRLADRGEYLASESTIYRTSSNQPVSGDLMMYRDNGEARS